MSDNIPFELQAEIIKRVLPVKSLIRFRSVSKQWKSLIDSTEFITHHTLNNKTQPQHVLVRYITGGTRHTFVSADTCLPEDKYVSIVDDDNFPQHKFSPVVPPTVKLLGRPFMLDCSHGLVCLLGYTRDRVNRKKKLVVVWNPLIGKSVGIEIPDRGDIVIGFGVVIDGVIHWLARDSITYELRFYSFDLASEKFGEAVDFPYDLACGRLYGISKINNSLVLHSHYSVVTNLTPKTFCDVCIMLKNGVSKPSFTKLFTVNYDRVNRMIGFRKNGQPIVDRTGGYDGELEVYEPCSERINGLGIYGSAFMMTSYKESLLLLNHSDSIIHS
ncbi:putative F-box domain-containing protein [Helianthus annuus]|uniref:F-box domain-containing protein n=1 Tax=Helianthus annuus TaxID=4232 RepID=A0A9K3ITF2_HELAN|nr:putative F-box domain-containing protein [Helianthus annuus]KAJ0741037.1 putative F-box domain-containing protein [Helianthus annuus]KAJ0915704.1 putative F-box domain-containing protein [Helianthus annuus]